MSGPVKSHEFESRFEWVRHGIMEYVEKPLTVNATRWFGKGTPLPAMEKVEGDGGDIDYFLETRQGSARVDWGDYIIHWPDGSFSVMKSHEFESRFEWVRQDNG